jgi:E3 ubiquitin-protein ligase makorin
MSEDGTRTQVAAQGHRRASHSTRAAGGAVRIATDVASDREQAARLGIFPVRCEGGRQKEGEIAGAEAPGEGDDPKNHTENVAAATFFAGKSRKNKYKPFVPNEIKGDGAPKEGDDDRKVAAAASATSGPNGDNASRDDDVPANRKESSNKKPSAVVTAAAAKAATTQPLCHFFLLGQCRYGSQCRFSHALPVGGMVEAQKQTPCPYFLRGSCRFGDACVLRHDAADLASDMTCGICLDDMRGKKFGLLSGCDHAFCLDCLRTWRATKSESDMETRTCPTCRKQSDFVVPSQKFCTGAEKEEVIEGYKAHLATVPCRRFTGAFGSCPFGRDCFYAHKDGTGKDVKADDMPRRRPRPRRNRGREEMSEELMDMYTFFLLFDLLAGRDSDSDDESDDDDDDESTVDDEELPPLI